MDFAALFAAVKENPAAALLVLALLALGWLAREYLKAKDAHATDLRALNDAHIAAIQKANSDHLATAMQIAPLAAKLADCVALSERLALARSGGGAA
jgi:hypothetical protein